jgi:hypothetical protein
MGDLNNLPCCGPVETVRVKDLPHIYGYDFQLHQCLGCGRTWSCAWNPVSEREMWEWVSETDAETMLAASDEELASFMRQWAARFA